MATSSTPSKPTSLKLPAARTTQLEQEAQRAGLSLHAFMVQTLADSVRHTRLRDAWARDSINALSDMTASGSGHELGDVRAYFFKLTRHRQRLQAKPGDLTPTSLG